MAQVNIARNPLQNINDVERLAADTIQEAFEAARLSGMMVIAVVNGVPTLRNDWQSVLQSDDVVLLVVRPRGGGGGGSNPMKLLATLAIMAFAGWIVGPSMLGLSGMSANLVKFGIMMAGSALINQLMPPPTLPETRALPEPSPSYSLRGQVNAARLGQPIPAHYGRHIVYPDSVMTPYYEYVGSDQYYNLLLCLGTGVINVTDIKFGDTTLDGLSDGIVQTQICLPGQPVSLLPATVYSTAISAELDADWTDAAITNPPGTLITKIGLDFAFNGLAVIGKSDGELYDMNVQVLARVRGINDAGTPTGDWVEVISHIYTDNTVDVIRDTQYATVMPGRYECQVMVSPAPFEGGKDADGNTVRMTCSWGGLRGYNEAAVDYGDVTLLAVRLKANEMLSDQQTQQISCIGSRQIPKYVGGSWAMSESRSIVWAVADMYLNANNGKQPANTLLLEEMATLDAKLEALNHHFDYRFDQSGQKLLDAMSIAARAGRSIVAHHIGRWRLLRDELKTTPVQMFTADNIVDCSITLSAPQAYDPDALVGTFIDPDTWQQDTLTFSDTENPIRPETVELTGITGRQHAWEELAYMARAEQRKERGTLTTGMEGRIPVIYDLIAVCPEGVNWGEWGHVTEIEGSTYKLSTPLSITSGKIMLRNSRGGSLGVYSFTADGSRAVLANPPALVLPDVQREPIYFIAGETESSIILAKVEGVKPAANNQVSIDFVVEDASTHDDAGTAPPTGVGSGGTGGGVSAETMVIPWLNVTNTLTSDTVCRMQFAWGAVAAATRYDAEIKVNDGAWKAVTVNADNTNISEVAPEQTVYFRVRARATAIIGAWRTLETASCSDAVPRDPGELSLRSPFITGVLKVKWTLVAGIANYVLRIYDTATLTLRREVNTTWQEYDYSYLDAISDGGTFRRMTLRLHTKLAGVISTTYSELEVYNPQVGALSGLQVVGFNGMIGILYDTPTQADYAGILVWSSETAGFTPSAENLVYDGKDPVIGIKTTSGAPYYVRVAAYDYWGRDELTLSDEAAGSAILVDLTEINDTLEELAYDLNHIDGTTQINENSISTGKIVAFAISADKIAANAITAGKIAALAVSADKIAANAVTADKMFVNNLAAISAALGTVTTGKMQNPTGRAVFNLDATGSQDFIYFADTLGRRRFSVSADGGLSITGAATIIDPNSGYPLLSSAMQAVQSPYIANAQYPTASSIVYLYGPNYHASVPIERRVRLGGIQFRVSASALADHYATLWYSTNGGGAWTPLWSMADYSPGVLSGTIDAALVVSASSIIAFCITSTEASGQLYGTDASLRHLTLTVSGGNI